MDFNKVSESEWEEIILKSNYSNFLHSPSWAKIMEKTYNYRPATRLYHINDKEILIPMLETNVLGFKYFFQFPEVSDAGGLFSESDITIDDFKLIAKSIIGGRNLRFGLTFPPFMKLSPGKLSSQIKEEWKVKDEFNYTHVLELEGKNYEDIWENDFHQRVRRSIRKAKKSGVEVRESTSLNDFKTFYNIYDTEASQKWGYKTPPIPLKLFKNLYKYGSNHVKLSLAIKDEKTIAGALSLAYSKTVYVFISAFLPEYGAFNPTSLLFNEAIKQACQEGYDYVNFGTSGNLKNVRKFKEKFGAGKVEVSRYRVYSNLGKMLSKSKIYRVPSS